MYIITIKNLSDSSETVIYESNETSKYIEKPSLSLEWQQPGSVSFTIIPGHPSYDDIKPIITFVYVYRDNEELFFGRVLTVDKELFGKKDVYCEGALNFLTDGQLLHSCDQTMTVTNFMIWCMNEMIGSGSDPDTIEARKQFIIGDIDSSLASQSAHFKTEEYAKPKSTLDEQLINRFGGCFVIKKETRSGVYSPSGHSISYLKTVGNVTSEKIRICENVRDRTDHDSGESIFTILRPIGANTGGDNDEPCKLSTNGGVIEIPAMIAKYGRICKTENFSDQDTESGLLAAAQAYIARLGMASDNLPKTCDIKFVDFHYLNPQITMIGFGDVFTDIEGYENQTMVVGHLELDLENPANDSLSLYNQTYLDAREYSALLESSTGAASTKNSSSRSSGGGGVSAIAKTLAGAAKTADDKTTEVEEHFKHVTSETNRELHDNFGIIGVKLDPNTHLPMKDASGNYIWAGPEDEQAEIWGNFQRSAWETIIANVVKDGKGNVLSIGQVSTSADGKVFIDAINDSRTGIAKINANRILIGTDSGSYLSIDENGKLTLTANKAVAAINAATAEINANKIALNSEGTITLASRLGIEANTNYLTIAGSARVGDMLFVTNPSGGVRTTNLTIGGSTGTQGEETGTLSYRGESFNIQRAFLGYPNNYITLGRILTTSASELDFNHAHAVSMTEETTGANAGKVHAVIGIPVEYSSQSTANRESFFDIAASQTYLNGVAAAYANAVNRVSWPTTPRTQSSFSVSVPGNPWNASTETGTTLNRIFALSNGNFDSNHISTVELSMSHNENGQVVTDGVVAKIDVDASSVYSTGETTGRNSVTISNSDIVRDGSDYYNATTHNTAIYIEATASNGAQGTQSFIVSGADAYSAGQNSVNVSMGNWNNGVVTFSPSAGTGNSKTLALSNISGSNTITANGNYSYEVMYEDEYGDDYSTGLTKSINVNVSTPTHYIVTLRNNSTTDYTRYDTYDIYPDEEVYFYPGTWNGSSYVPEITYPMKVVGHGGTCAFAFRYSTIGTQFQVHVNGVSSGLYGVLEYDDGYVYMRDAATGLDYARVYVADLV